MMNKMIKKLSAVAIAAAMTLSSGVAAQAATVNVYLRQWNQNTSKNTHIGTPNTDTFGRTPVFEITGVEKGTTYKDVLDEAASLYGPDYVFNWTGSNKEYLNSITIGTKTWGVDGGNTNEDKDSSGKVIGATWVGSAWMWYEGDNIDLVDTSSYPETTLKGTYVPVTTVNDDSEVISFVLSYDKTMFDWGTRDTTGTN